MLSMSKASRLLGIRWTSPKLAVSSSRCFLSSSSLFHHYGTSPFQTTTTPVVVTPQSVRRSPTPLHHFFGRTSNEDFQATLIHPEATAVLSQSWLSSQSTFLRQRPHALVPVTIGWVDIPAEKDDDGTATTTTTAETTLELMNRNARRGKRANKGKRPCSHVRRRKKRRAFGSWRR